MAAVILGAGAVAWATTDSSSGAGGAKNGQDRVARQTARGKCLQDAGVAAGQKPTPDQRQKATACLQAAGFAPGLGGPNGHGKGHGKGPGGEHLGNAIHGDLIVPGDNGGYQHETIDRGTEDGVSGDTLTLTRPDGQHVSVTLTNDTKYRGVDNRAGLTPGQLTIVVSRDGKALSVSQKHAHAESEPEKPET